MRAFLKVTLPFAAALVGAGGLAPGMMLRVGDGTLVTTPAKAAGSDLSLTAPYARLPATEKYRAEACSGDDVCDQRGAWEATAGEYLRRTQPDALAIPSP